MDSVVVTMSNNDIVVKQETTVGEEEYYDSIIAQQLQTASSIPSHTLQPISPPTVLHSDEIKYEIPLLIKNEIDDPNSNMTTTPNYYSSETIECKNVNDINMDASGGTELVESFVIYELETPAPKETPLRRIPPHPPPKTAAAAQTINPEKQKHQQQSKAPPTLLNAKFRKRKADVINAATGHSKIVSAIPRATATPTVLIPPVVQQKIKLTQPNNDTIIIDDSPIDVCSPCDKESYRIPSAPTATTSMTTSSATKLQVKCLCRLATNSENMPATNDASHELKEFFEEMFNETRQLMTKQQRVIKMTLLEAISLAEDETEAGKYCAKCCSTI